MRTFNTRYLVSTFLRTFFSSEYKQKTMAEVPKIYVRAVDGEDTMKITFSYGSAGRSFTFLRSKEEKLEISLFRMKHKVQNSFIENARKKKKKPEVTCEPVPLSINLNRQGGLLSTDIKNIDAWTPETEVNIGDCLYQVIKNPPAVATVSLPNVIMAGFPVYPKISLDFCNKEGCEFTWFRPLKKTEKRSSDEGVVNFQKENWLKLCDVFFYITNESDIGCKLRISCLPKNEGIAGKEESAVSLNAVQPGPGRCPFEDRHEHTKELTTIGFTRCVSYNILADLYADSETARNDLFPYCPTEALTLDYRRQLYLKEILGYNADLICLQEVDRKVFTHDLDLVLSTAGFSGIYNEKGGQVAEGLACFYRQSKFKVVSSHSIWLSEAITTEPVLQNLFTKLCENEQLQQRFLHRTTSLQVALLECLDIPKKRILVGNTHLYFHPESDNIRLIQGACCIQYLEKLLKQYQKKDPSYSTALVLTGDFNSCPQFGFYHLMTEGNLQDSDDWKSNPDEAISGVPLKHNLSLGSGCGTPEYTNYTAGFNGCLDYIFYDKDHFDVSEVVPFPSHNQVTEHEALPNKLFPSDHLALVCTLKWKH